MLILVFRKRILLYLFGKGNRDGSGKNSLLPLFGIFKKSIWLSLIHILARNNYGLDLGSYEIKVYDKKQDTIWKEKDVIAIRDKKEIFAVGDEAYEMYELSLIHI